MAQGVLIVDLKGTMLSDADRDFLAHTGIAGVLFFSRNFSDRNQLLNLIDEIRQVRQDLILMVDHEGGRVQRFKTDFVRLPAAGQLARYYLQDPQRGLTLVRDTGWLMASELLAAGIDLSLAPVLDLNVGKTDIIGDRAFGNDSETVIQLTTAWIEGVKEAGMRCVLKHFPGHGNVEGDSHLTLPVDHRTLDDILAQDMKPFKALIDHGADAVMPAHIVFSEVDDNPAGFSKRWLQDILRDELNFNGVVVSDCLTMEGAASAGGYGKRAKQALDAGCDLLIVSDRPGAEAILSDLSSFNGTAVDVNRLKPAAYPDYDALMASERFISCKDRIDYLLQRFE